MKNTSTRLSRRWGGDPSKIPPYTFESEDNLEYVAKAFEGVTPGGGGGVLVVGATIDEGSNTVTLDKTWQEIVDSDLAVLKVQANTTTIDVLSVYGITEGTYWVHFGGPDGELPDFNASSASGYPSATMG